MSRIPVLEVFGPTIQGEGMVIGRKTMFVRTAGCDYRCVWCDSKFTWDGSERARLLTPEAVWAELVALGGRRFNHVTISGGNPALIREPMADLIRLLHERGIRVGLETQGSVWQPWFLEIDDLTLSPKPPSSQMTTNWDALDDMVGRLRAGEVNFSFKIPVFDEEDLAYARRVHRRWPDVALYLSVGNPDPAAPGDVAKTLLSRLAWLVDRVVRDEELVAVRVLPQLHTLLWGNCRGV
ncbi:7-carboxy-7-deazaguanine synthase QueE [Alicyclobacillus sp.]|uniref:7-carboxy-7-deazaguanine synthase QueE n=1 Tax=Alicyclobacillus sp. TaxID=61169 RepID=UPI0025C34203|nr:7-carboxy-7-deazaguanine synthase QueE [Alicyclobacillus sp.]MCL6516275.1 7-carboxy-7-deazaguanine synthase QueE [Alicyclobacillus sp.]